MKLTAAQIQTFSKDGVLVVENLLSLDELNAAIAGLSETLLEHSVDPADLEQTGHVLTSLSSTNGSGGVLDLFYDEWKLQIIATHPDLFAATTQLWEAAYCHNNEQKQDLVATNDVYKWHPYGSFDCTKGYMYIDRIGYRIPTKLAHELGTKARLHATAMPPTSRRKKIPPIQRSLTPHLDCCPTSMFAPDAKKWRPIQCFVALTDALEPNHGGFEAALGFHLSFEEWARCRPLTRVMTAKASTESDADSTLVPAPCIGEYTHIRPTEDRDVMGRIQHVPVPAGSAVFWDNRYVECVCLLCCATKAHHASFHLTAFHTLASWCVVNN
jgi:hypothetical protein